MKTIPRALLALVIALVAATVFAAEPRYEIYFGATHGHTAYSGDAAKMMKEGNTPEVHYTDARKSGYQFYSITDHSHYDTFTTATFADTVAKAKRFSTPEFVALYGIEFSRNSGSGGKGHSNAFNTDGYLSALPKENTLDKYYGWLVEQGKTRPVAASFNHPGPKQYDDFACGDDARRATVTMLEVINSAKQDPKREKGAVGGLHYAGYLRALDKGWRVAPVAGLDAHTPWAISRVQYRTAILAEKLTAEGLLDGMRNRRTYATYDKNLHVTYTANGEIMGSVLNKPERLKFDVHAWDPDVTDPQDKITKIEIVGDDDAPVAAKTFDGHDVRWQVEVEAKNKYYLMKVYTAGLVKEPTAYIAPVWTGK